jgi:hypothetical protein
MANSDQSKLWALLLIGFGILFLLANSGWFAGLVSWMWALFFLAGGGAFLYLYNTNRERWWALIPGFSLLAIGAAALAGDAAGGIFLALIGTGFAAVYASDHRRWWAIIPAGVLFTLALIAWIEASQPNWDASWLFFSGIAATFGLLFVLPEGQGKQRWAIYPALASLALVALTILSSNIGGILVPLLLITAGAYLFWRQGPSRGPSLPKEASYDRSKETT